MNDKKRKIGNYEILCSVDVGGRETVLAVDEKNTDGAKFMCGFIEKNDILEMCKVSIVSDDYVEVVRVFGSKVQNEAELYQNKLKQLDVPVTLITKEDCIPDHYSKDINGKVVAINPSSLKPEYQRADKQLCLVIGGFGASANSRGSAVFCKNLHTGHLVRWERSDDIMGEVKPECLPEWAQKKLKSLNDRNDKTKKDYSLEM